MRGLMAESSSRVWKDYRPLVIILLLTILTASAKQADYGAWSWMRWMDDFMGFFFVVFSLFKFFDLSGFADGFQMYDLLARNFRPYAILYPFIELGLGLAYLANWRPFLVYTATIIVMVWGALGVVSALTRGLKTECACLGTILKVPLSTVALFENIAMAVMAAGMLAMMR